MADTANSKQEFTNICSEWPEVDCWEPENSGKKTSFNNWSSGDDNEQTSSSDSGSWTTNSNCSSGDFFFLREDLFLMEKEVSLTHKEALLINEFCEKIVSVGEKNEQEYKNEFCKRIESEQEYKGKSNQKNSDQKKSWTEGALGNIKNLIDEYLGRGIRLDSYCNDNKETVVDLIFKEIIGILESTTNTTSGSEALGFGPLDYDEDEAIKIENVTIIQSVVCQLLLRGGRIKRHLFYHDRIAHATTSFMGDGSCEYLDQYISDAYEEIKTLLIEDVVSVSIVNKGNQTQEYVLAVEINNEHFYVKCAQDSIIEPAKITNGIGSICSNTSDKVKKVVDDQESKIHQEIKDLKTEGQKIAALETEGQKTVDLKTLAHKITDLKISAYKIAGLENTDQETADLETLAYKIANLKKIADSKEEDQRIKEIEDLERLSYKIEDLKTEDLEILAHKIADLKTKGQKTEDLEILTHKIADLKILVHKIADLEALACKIADHNIAVQNLKVCILQIGKNTIGFECIEGKRNYIDLADGSDIVLTFYTSQGELEVRLYPDKQNKNLIRVEVEDQEMWKKLKDCNEKIGKNCSLGGYWVYDAIERGYFERSGNLMHSEAMSQSNGQTKKSSWVEREEIRRASSLEETVSRCR